MAASQQPLIYNNEGVEGHLQNQGVDPNVVVIVPVGSECPESNPMSYCSCGHQMVPGSQSCHQCSSYQRHVDPVVIVSQRPAPAYDRVDTYFENDNPTCLYFCAVLSLFVPIVGILIIFAFALWRPRSLRRGRRKRSAFIVLCIFTLIGSIFSFYDYWMGWEFDF